MKQQSLRIVDDSGITDRSIALWRLVRPVFGEFIEAEVFDNEASGLAAAAQFTFDLWALGSARLRTKGTGPPAPRGLILRDDRGQELVLSGCRAGYSGTGAGGTEEVLTEEHFLPEHIALIPRFGYFHVSKASPTPLATGEEARNY